MGTIWKRPGLIAFEVLWRWSAAVLCLLLLVRAGAHALQGINPDLAALQALTLFKPVAAAEVLQHQAALLLPPLLPVLRWWVPLAIALWTAAATLGRAVLWRRLDPNLQPRPTVLASFALLRLLVLLLFYAVWLWGLLAAVRSTIVHPAATGGDPNLVLCTACAVGLTLLLFLLWSVTVWLLDAAPLFAMEQRTGPGPSLRAALHSPALRSKLIEANLVLGIVKVCLLVLAMVFSATPLPFASVETTSFLVSWWAFVAVLYMLASDFFHLARRAAALALFRALVPAPRTTPARASAS